MVLGLLFQLLFFGFIALNILLLTKLFPVKQKYKRRAKAKKLKFNSF